MNTSKVKIDWKNVNKDDTEKLKALKKLIKQWDHKLPTHFVLVANNIINNTMYK